MQQKSTTQKSQYDAETHCPSCGRFTGTYTRCPYCQALTQKRISIKIFKVFSIVVSTFGMLLLLFYARNVKTVAVEISELGPLSNFAHVRIEGFVERSYGMHPQWGSVSFVIAQEKPDRYDSIRVTAYSQVAKNIESNQLIPDEGDLVSVEGQVRYQKDTASMLINTHEHLQIIQKNYKSPDEKPAIDLSPHEVSDKHLKEIVNLKGTVVRTASFASGVQVYLENGSAGFMVWIPSQTFEKDLATIAKGDTFYATGEIGKFKDELQLQIIKKGLYNFEPATIQPISKD